MHNLNFLCSKFKHLALLGALVTFSNSGWAQQQRAPLDRSLEPIDANAPAVSNVFRDMAVVQRKAMNKANKFLVSTYGGLDYSDGPYSMYAFQVNPGYAISDFWEVYINFAPFFISKPRSIVKKINDLGFDILVDSPKMQYGAELLWAPSYGKESISSKYILRSDTFFKVGVMQIKYESATGVKSTGLKLHSAVGKTFFINPWLGFRPSITANYVQTIIDNEKKFKFLAIVEAGFVFYL